MYNYSSMKRVSNYKEMQQIGPTKNPDHGLFGDATMWRHFIFTVVTTCILFICSWLNFNVACDNIPEK